MPAPFKKRLSYFLNDRQRSEQWTWILPDDCRGKLALSLLNVQFNYLK
jgi:hypothetical protein